MALEKQNLIGMLSTGDYTHIKLDDDIFEVNIFRHDNEQTISLMGNGEEQEFTWQELYEHVNKFNLVQFIQVTTVQDNRTANLELKQREAWFVETAIKEYLKQFPDLEVGNKILDKLDDLIAEMQSQENNLNK